MYSIDFQVSCASCTSIAGSYIVMFLGSDFARANEAQRTPNRSLTESLSLDLVLPRVTCSVSSFCFLLLEY